jgi:hypothetical protein
MPKSKPRRIVVYPPNCWPWQPREDTGVTIREEPAYGGGLALVIDARVEKWEERSKRCDTN